ncbi:MAG: HAD family hydrolase [Myxococcota bacterium]
MERCPFGLVAFDLDGTLVAHGEPIWKTLHQACGSDLARRKAVLRAALSGQISYADWFAEDIEMLQAAGASLEDIQGVLSALTPMDGATGLVRDLQMVGVKVVVISGGIQRVIDTVLPELTFDAVLINRLFFDDAGSLLGGEPTPFDRAHKVEGLRMLAERFGVPLAETAFIGDGPNDVMVAQVAGFSIAWGAADATLIEVADVHVNATDLDALRPLLFPPG